MSNSKNNFSALSLKFGAIVFKGFTAFLKTAKSLKFVLAAGTFGAYAYMFTWQFALLFIFGVGLHEMGHVWAMRRQGIPTKGFYFIPFVGGAAVADSSFESGKDEIYVSLMGPTVGVLTTAPPILLFLLTNSPFWAAAAVWLAIVNLFNLFPISPLDGGRFVKSIAFSFNSNFGIIILCVGFLTAIYLSYYANFSLLLFIAFVGMLEIAPLAHWFVLTPFLIILGIILTPLFIIIGIVVHLSRKVNGEHDPWLYWSELFVGYWKFVCEFVLEKYDGPIVVGADKMTPDHWKLTRKQLFGYVFWYVALVVIFLIMIWFLARVPGADIGKIFLES